MEDEDYKKSCKVSIALSKEENEKLTRFCRKKDMTKSYFVRMSVRIMMEKMERDNTLIQW